MRMISKCAAGQRGGETLFTIIQAQSPIPFYIQAQSFLHGFNIFSIFQECNYVHKSQEGYSVLFKTSQFQKTMPPMAAPPAETHCIMLVSLWACSCPICGPSTYRQTRHLSTLACSWVQSRTHATQEMHIVSEMSSISFLLYCSCGVLLLFEMMGVGESYYLGI